MFRMFYQTDRTVVEYLLKQSIFSSLFNDAIHTSISMYTMASDISL